MLNLTLTVLPSKEHPQNLVQGTLASLQEHFLCVHRPSIALHWHLINFSSSSGARTRTGEVSWNLGSIIPLMSFYTIQNLLVILEEDPVLHTISILLLGSGLFSHKLGSYCPLGVFALERNCNGCL